MQRLNKTPEIGDIIVTAERGEYTCSEVNPDGSFKGVQGEGFNHWDKYGEGIVRIPKEFQIKEINAAYVVVEVKKPNNLVQKPENNLEFQLRVLQKENEFLARLLFKKE